jgi:mannose-6-phosphate isomerase-like protein (cupin superfamily)
MGEAVLLAAGEGETIRPYFEIKVGRPELVLTETRYEPGQDGPDPHVHHHHCDAFWVLDGKLELGFGPPPGERREVVAGAFALVPPDVVHTFRNPGPGHATFLNMHAPGLGFDEYLRSGFAVPFDQHDPPEDGGRPASEVVLLEPGEGERLELGPSMLTVKAGADDGMGSLAVTDSTVAPGFPGPVLHHHERMVDSFYVLEGSIEITLGDERLTAGPCTYAAVPPGTAHTFGNPGPDPARVLNVMGPAGLERYLRELAQLGGPPDQAVMAEVASKYDFVPA